MRSRPTQRKVEARDGKRQKPVTSSEASRVSHAWALWFCKPVNSFCGLCLLELNFRHLWPRESSLISHHGQGFGGNASNFICLLQIHNVHQLVKRSEKTCWKETCVSLLTHCVPNLVDGRVSFYATPTNIYFTEHSLGCVGLLRHGGKRVVRNDPSSTPETHGKGIHQAK